LSHKHRRPRAVSRIGRRPLHLGVAAGVAGTVAMTGTLVAAAAPSTPAPKTVDASPGSAALDVSTTNSTAEDRASQQLAQQRALLVRQQRLQDEAKARAAAKAKAAKKAAAKKAAAKRLAAAARKKKAAASRSSRGFSDEQMTASAAHVLSIAASKSGSRYVHGGSGPYSFDCSGFTMYVFGKVGISLPHSAAAQRSMVRSIPRSAVRPGDLVFVYNGGGGSVGHVAIYAGNGYWYEASNPSTGVGKHRAWSSNVSYGRVL
jgi:cell wall-associated NlpC family hydrolase